MESELGHFEEVAEATPPAAEATNVWGDIVRLSPGAAVAFMRSHGFEPDEPYPGGVDKPWLCICQRCKEFSRKTVTNVRAGKGCKFCKSAVIDATAAVEEMRAAGLEPLVPYPGSNTAWRCRCLICGFAEAAPTLSSVRKGVRCRACAGQLADLEKIAGELCGAGFVAISPYPGVDRPWQMECLTCKTPANLSLTSVRAGTRCRACTEERAAQRYLAWMREIDLEPQVPYPGWLLPWLTRCINCEMPVSSSLVFVRQGGGRCPYCGGTRIDPNKAAVMMRDAKLEPLIDFPGINRPWRCTCMRCRKPVSPSLANIRRGQGGCVHCGQRVVDPAVAVAVMRAAYLEPQVPFTASAAKWPCLCLRCGQLVEPTFNNVSTKRVACKYCAASGLDYGGPACIYVLHHAGEGAVKIGIAGTGARNERILKHQRHGWSLCYRLPVDTGARAFAVEQAASTNCTVEAGPPICPPNSCPKADGPRHSTPNSSALPSYGG